MGACVVFLFILVSVINVANAQQDYYCKQPVDIAFLLDSSIFFGKQNFEDVKIFAKNFITYLSLDEQKLGPHVAFLAYSDRIAEKRMINFRYSSSIKRLSRTIDYMLKFDGNRTSRLDHAFVGARKVLFQRNKGYRSWVPHVVIAITGSWRSWGPNRRSSVRREARELRKAGFQLLVASVGDFGKRDRTFLESLVDSKDDVFMVRYAYRLMQEAEKMVRRLCPVLSVHPCPGIVDMAFIVDSSGSIAPANYRKIKYFVYSIANALNVSVSGAHAGVVIYSTHAEMVIKFTDYMSVPSFQKAVYKLKHMRRFTRIDRGLTIAHSVLFHPVYGGARSGVKKLAFILTDGKQNPDEKGVNVSVGAAAKPLMDDNIKTISIGIGSDVDEGQLRSMVEFDEDVIRAANFDELIRKIQNITEQTCEEISFSKCQYPADIAFLLDSSTNVNRDDFALEKSFVRTMAKLFRVFQYGSRGAVIVFGDEADLSVELDSHKNYRDFIDAVSRLSLVGGRRRTHKALQMAEEVLTDYSGGARRKVPKVVLLLTAGPESDSRDVQLLRETAKRLHDRNILVIVVGIGPSLITAELTFMVQSRVNLFLAKSFAELKKQLVSLSEKTCEEVGPGVCGGEVDLAFILDSSGSITPEDYDEARYFVKQLAQTFTISPKKTHVALMIYSDKAHIKSKFGKINSNKELESKLDALPHLKGKTRIDLALKLASNELFTWSGGMRLSSSVAKVAIVITDGRQSPAPDGIGLDEAAAALLVQGVKVISVGIGNNIDRHELNMMVHDPDRDVFWAKSYRALRVQLATIARVSCSGKTYLG